MSDTVTPPSTSDVDPANEPAGSSEILFGAGQGAWLTLVTVVAGLALALSIVALLRDNGEGTAVAPPSGPVTDVTFSATEFAFDPAQVTVAAGTEVAVALENDGSVVHNLAILPEGVTVASEDELADADFVLHLSDLDAGASESDSVTLEAGTYQFVCTISGHFSAGMAGSITAQ